VFFVLGAFHHRIIVAGGGQWPNKPAVKIAIIAVVTVVIFIVASFTSWQSH